MQSHVTRPPERPRHTWDDNIRTVKVKGKGIRMVFKDIWCGLDSAALGYGTLSNYCEHGNEPSVDLKDR